MLLRLLFLISMLGYTTGPDAREEDDRLGGEGFGTIMYIFVAVGAILLIGMIVVAIMAMTGNFKNDLLDPVV